jgi:hypothetical protein
MNEFLQTPLTDREAGRVKTMLKQKNGRELKLRELIMFSPAEIAKAHEGINAGEIARFAGRKDERELMNAIVKE